jgi:hypothetical protein
MYCNFPGHQANSVSQHCKGCREAIFCMIGFWGDTSASVARLSQLYIRFAKALRENKPTYEMKFDGAPQIAENMAQVIVNHLTRNYLHFQPHYHSIRAKAVRVIFCDGDEACYNRVTELLNGLLLNGRTCQYFSLYDWVSV